MKPPPRRCATRSCPSFEPCPDHEVRKTNRQRRDYDGSWTRIRNVWIKANPLCAHCGAKAQEVDHIIPIRLGGGNDGNLQSLCKPCHLAKTHPTGSHLWR
jgi:5-methylcytosine-specific restriction enzyme A